jgi:signal transduction histidine kinase
MGFSIALGFYFIYSIYIPLFTMQKIAESYSTGLEKQVQDRTYELMKSNELLSISNNELKNLNTNLASVTRENQMLLSILVHDISNPVQVIMSFVEKATKAEKSPSNSMYEKVKNALGTILDTLSTVKSYHSVRVGKILPKAAELDIVETVRSVVSQFEEKITAKNLKLEIAVQPDCRTLVVSDKTWIKNQIFSNILSNAIKFSYPNEPIKINVSSVKSGVCVSFRDFGPGIPEDAKRNIFSSSVSTTTLGTQGEKGTGLGMPIVKDYVVRLNGTVEIINLPEGERGTCFQIYIPYEFKKPESL